MTTPAGEYTIGAREGRRVSVARAGLVVERAEPFQIFSAGIPAFPMRLIYARRA